MPRTRAPRARRRTRATTVVVVAAGLGVSVLAGCSNASSAVSKNPHTGDETASTQDGVQQITMTTGPDLRFHPSTITVHPGRVRITLKNVAPDGGPPHNLQSSKVQGMAISEVDANQKQSVSFVAPAPGRYRFVCTFHQAQGQTGTLVVERG